ncbi:MAG TPA: MFS transporter [Caulobacteraceae bacterium]|nr:MFS transporter [Caulobacteraceae bacterium]
MPKHTRPVGAVTPTYERLERESPLGFRVKLAQGIGAVPDTVMNWAFNTFVLLYYNQLLGVDALLVSAALGVAIFADAFIDPLIASISDHLKSRWGRRHPLMFAGALPLGFLTFAVFAPPAGLSSPGLFAWLTLTVLLTRAACSLFFVPWAAISAELSDDYDERTSIMSYRYAVGWASAVFTPFFVFGVLMPATRAHPIGQLDASHYPAMAACVGAMMTIAGLATTFFTRRQIPYLRQPTMTTPFSWTRPTRELVEALSNRQFALIFVIVLMASAIGGVTANIDIYMNTFFWGLDTAALQWFALVAVGAAAAFPLIAAIQRRWEKRDALLLTSWVSLAQGMGVVALRFAGALPPNGSPALLAILILNAAVGSAMLVVQGVIGASVIGDILDQHELQTGLRQEGMFWAAIFLSIKAISGLGIVFGGLVLKLVNLPAHADPAHVAHATVNRLGFIVGILVPLFYAVPIWLIGRYRITRRVHAEIQAALAQRRGLAQASP